MRAGLAIIEKLARLPTPAGAALAARIGIATGLVMVGELIGEGAAQERTVVGETPISRRACRRSRRQAAE